MKLADIRYSVGEYMGDRAYFFDINQRYHGYTRDKLVFHVYDENTNSYTSYSAAEFDNLLSSNFFESGNVFSNVSTSNLAPGYYSMSSTNSWGLKEYLFIGIGIIFITYLAYEGARS